MVTVKEIDYSEMLVKNFGVIRTQDQGIIPIQLFPWQEKFLEVSKIYNDIIIDKSREVGSSTIANLNFAVETVLFGGDFLIASYKKESSEFLFETARLFLENLKNEFKKIGFSIDSKIDTKSELILDNGSHIKAMEMTPKVGRSFRYKRLLATEVAFWENARESWQALEGASVKDARRVIESTPNPDQPEGELFEELLQNPEFYKMEVDWRENPAHDAEWERKKRALMSDREFAQEYEHSHQRSASGNLVIPLSFYYASVNKEVPESEPIEFGVDVARYGDDDSIIRIRKGNNARRFLVYQKNNTQELADEVFNQALIEKPSSIKIDAVGVGAGVVDALNRKVFPFSCEVVEINESMSPTDEKYLNARAEMYFNLREKMMTEAIAIDDDPKLKVEISNTHYKTNSNMKIQIEAKDDIKKKIKRSPDRFDSLALAFYDREGGDPSVFFA